MKVQPNDLWPIILDFVNNFYGKTEVNEIKDLFSLKIDFKVSIISLYGNDKLTGAFNIYVII